MFSSTGLFKKTPCPFQDKCEPSQQCIFLHEDQQALKDVHQTQTETANKRRRLNFVSGPEQQKWQSSLAATSTRESNHAKPLEVKKLQFPSNVNTTQTAVGTRPISPPQLSRPAQRHEAAGNNVKQPDKTASEIKEETLNPRLMQNAPAPHATRLTYLKKIHEQFARLNSALAQVGDEEASILLLSEQQLIKLALDEEEKHATDSPGVYANVIKLRMLSLSRMKVEEWKLERQSAGTVSKTLYTSSSSPQQQIIVTDLSPTKEISVLQHLTASEKVLKKYGFNLSTPTEKDIVTAEDGAKAARSWEICDRCKSRFQVFPHRREDGAIAGGGECIYHPGRAQSSGNQNSTEKTFTCCNAPVGSSAGCASARNHVFKIENCARLASVCQFLETPENSNARPAVSFDCEMGYTTFGMELIRLTVLSWPEGEILLDVLVWPLGIVIDLNTRYSGVIGKDYAAAVPHGTAKDHSQETKQLEVVESPIKARELLFNLISPSTVLVGHSLENDLNAIRVIHPTIVDSTILYPHHRGPPYRLALKRLAKEHLSRDIQMQTTGHDPQEDAKTAGDLVRLRVGRQWRLLKKEGWVFEENTDKLVNNNISVSKTSLNHQETAK